LETTRACVTYTVRVQDQRNAFDGEQAPYFAFSWANHISASVR
jgi:hypothetical protein